MYPRFAAPRSPATPRLLTTDLDILLAVAMPNFRIYLQACKAPQAIDSEVMPHSRSEVVELFRANDWVGLMQTHMGMTYTCLLIVSTCIWCSAPRGLVGQPSVAWASGAQQHSLTMQPPQEPSYPTPPYHRPKYTIGSSHAKF